MIFTALGTDVADYQHIAEVLRMVAPVEPLLVDGEPMACDAFESPQGVRVRGMRCGDEDLILVSRYDQETAADITVRIKAV